MKFYHSLQSICISFFFILAFGPTTQAQVFVKALEIGNGPTNCDAIVEVSSINVPAGSVLSTQYSNTTIIADTINYIDTLYNVCDTNVNGSYLPYDQYVRLYHSAYGFNGTIIIAGVFPQGLDYTFSNYIAPSNAVAQDGEITIVFSQPIVPAPMFGSEMFTHGPFGNDAVVSTTDSITFQVSGIAEGPIRGDFILNGSSPYYQLMGYIGDPIASSINNNLSVTLNASDATSNCNGTASLTVDSTATGVTYLWNDTIYNGLSSIDSLCPGYYAVLVEDDNGNNALLSFLISDVSVNYWTPWNNVNLPLDTLQFAMSNCNIDFFAGVDSVTWMESNYLNVGDTSYYQFELNFYQDTNVFIFIDTFYLTTDTLVYLACGMYCETFKMVSFEGFKIFLAHDGTQNMNGVAELKQPIVLFYPNPAHDKLILAGTSNAFLYDGFGRVIQELQAGENDISKVPSGLYLIINSEHQQIGKLVVE